MCVTVSPLLDNGNRDEIGPDYLSVTLCQGLKANIFLDLKKKLKCSYLISGLNIGSANVVLLCSF